MSWPEKFNIRFFFFCNNYIAVTLLYLALEKVCFHVLKKLYLIIISTHLFNYLLRIDTS